MWGCLPTQCRGWMKAINTRAILMERLETRKMKLTEKSRFDGNRKNHSFSSVWPAVSWTDSAGRQALKELAAVLDRNSGINYHALSGLLRTGTKSRLALMCFSALFPLCVGNPLACVFQRRCHSPHEVRRPVTTSRRSSPSPALPLRQSPHLQLIMPSHQDAPNRQRTMRILP